MERNRKNRKAPANKSHAPSARDDARTLQEQGRGDILSDVLGSYTGTPETGGVPEQDADDL